MTLKSQMAQDAVSTFLNSDEFAENVSYTAYGESPKTIKAVVERDTPEPTAEDRNRTAKNQAIIHIANEATYGVTGVSKGRDKVEFPANIGGADVVWVVTQILKQDDGMFTLLVVR